MNNPYWSCYEDAITEAALKIDSQVRNNIGYEATKGNTQPPDEAIVAGNAASAFEFFTEKLDEFYPERSAESKRHIARFIDAIVELILTPGNTTRH
jgi:hypothetical protein